MHAKTTHFVLECTRMSLDDMHTLNDTYVYNITTVCMCTQCAYCYVLLKHALFHQWDIGIIPNNTSSFN